MRKTREAALRICDGLGIKGGQKHYDVVDFLKGFSITTIVLMHIIMGLGWGNSSWILSKILPLGGAGVHVFFMCSGFGLYLSQKKHKLSFGQYVKKKFSKIYLPYIFVVLVSACVPYMFDGSLGERLFALSGHMFLFKMFVPGIEDSFGLQFWFMSTLFQFYLLFPVLYKIYEKIKTKKFLLGALAISLMYWFFVFIIGASEIRPVASFCLAYVWEFAFGMCAAEFLSSGKEFRINNFKLLALGALCFILAAAVTLVQGGRYKIFNDVFIAVAYLSFALFIYGVFGFLRKFFSKMCEFSYEWYLTHILVFWTIMLLPIPKIVCFVVTLGLSIGVAVGYRRVRGKGWLCF